MGTKYIVKVSHFPDHVDWQKIADEIQKKLDALDQKMSTYRYDSEVSRFNTSPSTEDWFSVSPETAQVVQMSLDISKLSGGAFDITVAPLIQHWGFGAGGNPRTNKSFEELKSSAILLKEQTGYEKLSVRIDPPALKKAVPELTIDLSAIAKGYAVDCVAAFLEEQKVTDYLIEIGGEVRVKGKKDKTKHKDWIVGIEKPVLESLDQDSDNQQELILGDNSLATSGSYLQTFQFQIEGQRVSHIIDPRTGLPAQIENDEQELVAVSVVFPNCADADAWATAMFVLGEQKGIELADKQGFSVLFLLYSGGEIVEVPSKHWQIN